MTEPLVHVCSENDFADSSLDRVAQHIHATQHHQFRVLLQSGYDQLLAAKRSKEKAGIDAATQRLLAQTAAPFFHHADGSDHYGPDPSCPHCQRFERSVAEGRTVVLVDTRPQAKEIWDDE